MKISSFKFCLLSLCLLPEWPIDCVKAGESELFLNTLRKTDIPTGLLSSGIGTLFGVLYYGIRENLFSKKTTNQTETDENQQVLQNDQSQQEGQNQSQNVLEDPHANNDLESPEQIEVDRQAVPSPQYSQTSQNQDQNDLSNQEENQSASGLRQSKMNNYRSVECQTDAPMSPTFSSRVYTAIKNGVIPWFDVGKQYASRAYTKIQPYLAPTMFGAVTGAISFAILRWWVLKQANQAAINYIFGSNYQPYSQNCPLTAALCLAIENKDQSLVSTLIQWQNKTVRVEYKDLSSLITALRAYNGTVRAQDENTSFEIIKLLFKIRGIDFPISSLVRIFSVDRFGVIPLIFSNCNVSDKVMNRIIAAAIHMADDGKSEYLSLILNAIISHANTDLPNCMKLIQLFGTDSTQENFLSNLMESKTGVAALNNVAKQYLDASNFDKAAKLIKNFRSNISQSIWDLYLLKSSSDPELTEHISRFLAFARDFETGKLLISQKGLKKAIDNALQHDCFDNVKVLLKCVDSKICEEFLLKILPQSSPNVIKLLLEKDISNSVVIQAFSNAVLHKRLDILESLLEKMKNIDSLDGSNQKLFETAVLSLSKQDASDLLNKIFLMSIKSSLSPEIVIDICCYILANGNVSLYQKFLSLIEFPLSLEEAVKLGQFACKNENWKDLLSDIFKNVKPEDLNNTKNQLLSFVKKINNPELLEWIKDFYIDF